ncbi:MAG: hypothetical protein AABZ84_08855 [Pseudomonadota bacterium]
MTLLMAFMFLLAGVICISRPMRIVAWLDAALKKPGNASGPVWLQGRGIGYFIQVMGFLSLVNAVMYLYLAQQS